MSVPPQDPNQPYDPNQPGAQPPYPPQGGHPGQQPQQGGQPGQQPQQGGQPGQPVGGQWQGGQQVPPAPPQPGNQEGAMDAKGFFAALFDWRFHTLITPKIVSIVYLVGMVLIGLGWLGSLITGFNAHPAVGLVVLIIGPIIAVVYLAFWRMTLEFYFAIVRMSDDIHRTTGVARR